MIKHVTVLNLYKISYFPYKIVLDKFKDNFIM